MAVGLIITCNVCKKAFDSDIIHICDNGEELRQKDEAFEIFKSMSVDDRLEYLFKALQSLTDRVNYIPEEYKK
ncbi:hypothetical protein BH09PAT1_BH09PAT1_8410 [soil metagenome]